MGFQLFATYSIMSKKITDFHKVIKTRQFTVSIYQILVVGFQFNVFQKRYMSNSCCTNSRERT